MPSRCEKERIETHAGVLSEVFVDRVGVWAFTEINTEKVRFVSCVREMARKQSAVQQIATKHIAGESTDLVAKRANCLQGWIRRSGPSQQYQ